jgi:aspartate carbamoyltransferase catalytic subunit
MGADVVVAGLPTMMPVGIEKMGVDVTHSIDAAIEGADVIMMLRIQKERLANPLFPTEREYSITFGLNSKRLELAKKDVVIMHPGPINRGVEIAPELADGSHSLILDQVKNGVAVRMALLYLLAGLKQGDN